MMFLLLSSLGYFRTNDCSSLIDKTFSRVFKLHLSLIIILIPVQIFIAIIIILYQFNSCFLSFCMTSTCIPTSIYILSQKYLKMDKSMHKITMFVFKLTCLSLTAYMSVTQFLRYLDNNDKASVSFRLFNHSPRDRYPTYTICFENRKQGENVFNQTWSLVFCHGFTDLSVFSLTFSLMSAPSHILY